MQRPGGVPQSLRGLPNGFAGQQQPPPQQQARAVSSRMPTNGKLANNASGWAFSSGVPLAGAAVQIPGRSQQMGGNISFAQSLGGSQPATPLDLSEFPSLSNSSQLASGGPTSLWSGAGSRNIVGQGIQRNSSTPLSAQHQQHQQQAQQDDLFAVGSRIPSNPSSGEIGDRSSNLIASLGFGSQASGALAGPPGGRVGNGLLNALSANSRAGEVRSPVGTRPPDSRGSAAEDDARNKQPPFREDGRTSQPSAANGVPGAIGAEGAAAAKGGSEATSSSASVPKDPLATMAPAEKWGMKGLHALMNTHPGYSAVLRSGLDFGALGVDLNANDLISTQVYSLFDSAAPRPAIPKFRLPECYKVTNVGPIENKITSFNEETLMWIFYSCPNDVKQQMAALELTNRNWRWHKRQQVWLTKDDMMMPQVLSQTHERGFYIIWDTVNWRKERTQREITLSYADLDNSPIAGAGA